MSRMSSKQGVSGAVGWERVRERAFAFGAPGDLVRPFDAMLGLPGDGCDCA